MSHVFMQLLQKRRFEPPFVEELPFHPIESSTNSIRNQTHSAGALKSFEKFDVSCFHADIPKEEIWTSIVEELSFHPTEVSTNSIRNHTHYVVALKIFEKNDVSCFHGATTKEVIRTSIVE